MIEVFDDYLPLEVFKTIKEYVLSEHIPWYFSSKSVYEDDNCPQFSHTLYGDFEPISDVWSIIRPVMATLDPIGLYRIKFNSTPRTSEIIKKPLHYDISDAEGNVPNYNVCIIYINDNNGYTYFEDNQKVESKANRAVIFSGDVLHAGTSCTDSNTRVVLNIDYSK